MYVYIYTYVSTRVIALIRRNDMARIKGATIRYLLELRQITDKSAGRKLPSERERLFSLPLLLSSLFLSAMIYLEILEYLA